MTISQPSPKPSQARGITVIEILMVISLAAILISFAIPSVSGAAARAEMKSATENIEFSIDSARKAARMSGRPVAMHVQRLAEEPAVIRFSAPGSPNLGFAQTLDEYHLPGDIRLECDRDTYRFDARGMLDAPGQLILVSLVDETITTVVKVSP